jgi:hypothetical protein
VLVCSTLSIECHEQHRQIELPGFKAAGGFAGMGPSVTVTVMVTVEERPDKVMSLEEIFAARRPPYKTKEEIDAEIRRLRDEWDD